MNSFSSITSPLTKLTQKKVNFLKSDAYKGRFENLKDKITLARILTLMEGTNGFVTYCNVSPCGAWVCSDTAW